MPAAETKRDGKGEFLAKDLSIWRQTPGPGADAGSGSRIQAIAQAEYQKRAELQRVAFELSPGPLLVSA